MVSLLALLICSAYTHNNLTAAAAAPVFPPREDTTYDAEIAAAFARIPDFPKPPAHEFPEFPIAPAEGLVVGKAFAPIGRPVRNKKIPLNGNEEAISYGLKEYDEAVEEIEFVKPNAGIITEKAIALCDLVVSARGWTKGLLNRYRTLHQAARFLRALNAVKEIFASRGIETPGV